MNFNWLSNSINVVAAEVFEPNVDAMVSANLCGIGSGLFSLGDHAILFSVWILDAALGAELN